MKLKTFLTAFALLAFSVPQSHATVLSIFAEVTAERPPGFGASVGDPVRVDLDIDDTVADSNGSVFFGEFFGAVSSVEVFLNGSSIFDLSDPFSTNEIKTDDGSADNFSVVVRSVGTFEFVLASVLITGTFSDGNSLPDVLADYVGEVNSNSLISIGSAVVTDGQPGGNAVEFRNITGARLGIVPVPAAFPLLASAIGLVGLVGYRRRKVQSA